MQALTFLPTSTQNLRCQTVFAIEVNEQNRVDAGVRQSQGQGGQIMCGRHPDEQSQGEHDVLWRQHHREQRHRQHKQAQQPLLAFLATRLSMTLAVAALFRCGVVVIC